MDAPAAPKVRYLPPPVCFESGGAASRVAKLPLLLLGSLWCLGGAAVLYGLPWRLDTLLMGGVALVLSGCAVYLETHPREHVILDWSSQGWRLFLGPAGIGQSQFACVPTVVLDLQRLLLVRVQGLPGGVRWLWCEQQDARQWHRFRCALFAVRQP